MLVPGESPCWYQGSHHAGTEGVSMLVPGESPCWYRASQQGDYRPFISAAVVELVIHYLILLQMD
jgi:hypothetical protein